MAGLNSQRANGASVLLQDQHQRQQKLWDFPYGGAPGDMFNLFQLGSYIENAKTNFLPGDCEQRFYHV